MIRFTWLNAIQVKLYNLAFNGKTHFLLKKGADCGIIQYFLLTKVSLNKESEHLTYVPFKLFYDFYLTILYIPF